MATTVWRLQPPELPPPTVVQLTSARQAHNASFSPDGDRIAFASAGQRGDNRDIWLKIIGADGARRLTTDPAVDDNPAWSPDGRRIAFTSSRADERSEIWLAEADGTRPTRLTHGPGRHQGGPRWSPDGSLVAFDSYADDGHADIWAIGVDGSGLRQVTHDPGDAILPSWSRDGRFLYFVSNRTGRDEIWRIAASGEGDEQVTDAGAQGPIVESADGRTLYYRGPTQGGFGGALLSRPTAGGERRMILPCLTAYDIGRRGLVYMECPREGAGPAELRLHERDVGTGADRPVATIGTTLSIGLSVSPDGQTIIYDSSSSWGTSDVMMIDNFR